MTRLLTRKEAVEWLAQELDVSPARAKQALENLERRGLIQPIPSSPNGDPQRRDDP